MFLLLHRERERTRERKGEGQKRLLRGVPQSASLHEAVWCVKGSLL